MESSRLCSSRITHPVDYFVLRSDVSGVRWLATLSTRSQPPLNAPRPQVVKLDNIGFHDSSGNQTTSSLGCSLRWRRFFTSLPFRRTRFLFLLFRDFLTHTEQTQLIANLRTQNTHSNDQFKVPHPLKPETHVVIDILCHPKSYSNITIHCISITDIDPGNYSTSVNCLHSLLSPFETELVTLQWGRWTPTILTSVEWRVGYCCDPRWACQGGWWCMDWFCTFGDVDCSLDC